MEDHEVTTPEFAHGRECRVLRNVKVRMRDGVRLSTSVYLPLAGGPFPVVLVRSAYNRMNTFDAYVVSHGMALVVQDCRGRYDSEGEFYPFVHEGDDGFDTLEWIGGQPWCNGRVGMFGDSYLAATQLLTASTGSRFLHALNPRFMAEDCWKRAYYCDGAFSLALTWSWLCFESCSRTSEASRMPLLDVATLLRKLPIVSLDEAGGAGPVGFYRDYVTHCSYDDHWRKLNVGDHYQQFRMPVLWIGGWCC